MFDCSMEKESTLSLLYALMASLTAVLCISHYLFGYFDVLLVQLIAMALFIFAAIFLLLNRNRAITNMINLITLSLVVALIQYQLHFNPELSLHWLYVLSVMGYFALPLSWACGLSLLVLLCSVYQLVFLIHSQQQALTAFLSMYLLINICAFAYAYINSLKQSRLLKLAVTDYQSGAYNSRYLLQKTHEEIARSETTSRTLSMFAVTIDDYQQIEDIHGKNILNPLIKRFRHKLIVFLRAGDEIFHNGQGTFFILLPNCSKEGGALLKQRLLKDMEDVDWGDVGDLQLNVGLASLNHQENAESFLRRASDFLHKQQQTSLRLMAFN